MHPNLFCSSAIFTNLCQGLPWIVLLQGFAHTEESLSDLELTEDGNSAELRDALCLCGLCGRQRIPDTHGGDMMYSTSWDTSVPLVWGV